MKHQNENDVSSISKLFARELAPNHLHPWSSSGHPRLNGDFAKGDVVRICDLNGTEFSRGISRFDAEEIRARTLKGIEIVHRNDLVIL